MSSDATLQVGVYEAKSRLSELLDRAERGEDIIITRRGRAVAQLSAVSLERTRVTGFDRGRIHIADDFDAPLPDDMLTDIS